MGSPRGPCAAMAPLLLLLCLPPLHADLPTGRGVIVGIVDNGLNWRHEAFRDPRNPDRSRVLYLRAEGREWDREAIEAALRDAGESPPAGPDSGINWLFGDLAADHGTMMAGLAAGSAWPGARVPGTAPEADIIFVSSFTSLTDAAGYVFGKAEALGRRAVVNFSIYTDEPKQEVARLGRLLAADDRRIIVAAAGNLLAPFIFGDGTRLHWEVVLGEAPVFTTLHPDDLLGRPGDPSRLHLDLWLREGSDVELGLGRSMEGLSWRRVETLRGSTMASDTLENGVTVRWRLLRDSPLMDLVRDGDHEFLSATLDDPGYEWGGDPYLLAARGEGMLQARALRGYGREEDRFASLPGYRPMDLYSTIVYPAVLPQVIAVGGLADTTGRGALDEDPRFYKELRNHLLALYPGLGQGRLLPLSARGPSPAGRVKPDLVAPGMGWGPGIEGGQEYVWDLGTSLAAARVSGLIAAFLQRFPEATRQEVYEAFAGSARAIGEMPAPNNLWGHGQADLAGALDWHQRRTATFVAVHQEEAGVSAPLSSAPNPFNAGTTIGYRLEEPGSVRLQIFNLLGQRIATLIDGYRTAGAHRVYWDAARRRRAGGLYFARLWQGDGPETVKLLLME